MRAAKAVFLFGFGVLAIALGLELAIGTVGHHLTNAEAQTGVAPFVGISDDGNYPSQRAWALTQTGDVYSLEFSEGTSRFVQSLPAGNYVAFYNHLYGPRFAITDDGRAYTTGFRGGATFTLDNELSPGLIDSPIAFYNESRRLWVEEDGDVWRDNEYLGNLVSGVVSSASQSFGELKASY